MPVHAPTISAMSSAPTSSLSSEPGALERGQRGLLLREPVVELLAACRT